MKRIAQLATLALACSTPLAAGAADAGDWTVKVGAHGVDPRGDNGSLAGDTLDVDIDSDWRPSIMGEYYLTPNWGIELLAALPFQHDVDLNGTHAATIKHLPPTLSLQYHFNGAGKVSPYLGAGINFTWIYDEEERGPLAGTELKLDNSWGLAAHAGIDWRVGDDWFVGADVRWLDIDADARVNGAGVGTVNVDPLAFGLYVGWVF